MAILGSPLWAGARVYFISDHEGVGNLYSCTAKGRDLRLEAAHQDFYIRNPATDGKTIVYHAGGDLYAFDVASRVSLQAPDRVSLATDPAPTGICAGGEVSGDGRPRSQKGNAAFIACADRSTTCGTGTARSVRIGAPGSRCRLARFLADGRVIVAVDGITVTNASKFGMPPISPSRRSRRLRRMEPDPRIGGGFDAARSLSQGGAHSFRQPSQRAVALEFGIGDQSQARRCTLMVRWGPSAWSPDGRWLAFQKSENRHQHAIAIASVETGEIRAVTKPLFVDYGPSFDPDGRYLELPSDCVLNPVWDDLQF